MQLKQIFLFLSILAANCCCQNVNSMDMQMFSACYYLIFIILMLRSSGEIRQLRDREWANYIVSRGQSINWNWSGIYSNLMIDSPVEQWGMWFLNISEMKTKLKVTQWMIVAENLFITENSENKNSKLFKKSSFISHAMW